MIKIIKRANKYHIFPSREGGFAKAIADDRRCMVRTG